VNAFAECQLGDYASNTELLTLKMVALTTCFKYTTTSNRWYRICGFHIC